MGTFQPGAYSFHAGQAQTYNFLSAVDLIKKSVDDGIADIYGSQQLFLLSERIGGKKEVTNKIHNWFESRKIMPLVKCTNGGAGAAGAAVTFTVSTTTPNNQILNLSQANPPYPAGSQNPYSVGSPIKVGDIITIPPASGLAVPSNVIKARVMSVTATTASTSSLTFSAVPLDAADAIPSLPTAVEVIIGTNAYGEGSSMPTSSTVMPVEKTASLQIIKHKYSTTGTAKSVQTWLTDVPFYTVRGEEEAATIFMNKIELGFLDGQNFDNALVQTTPETPISMSKGLINSIIEDGGYVQTYTPVNGYGMPEFEELSLNLDKETNGSCKDFMFEAGIELAFSVDRSMADQYKNGSITYGAFGKGESQAATLNYEMVKRGTTSYYIKEYAAFNNTQLFGSPNFAYNQCGMIIPMKGGADAKSGAQLPAIQTLYLKDREYIIKDWEGISQGTNGEDIYEVRYMTERGWQFYGLNRYAFIEAIV